MKTNTKKHAASTALEDLDQMLGSSLKKINNEHQALKDRNKDIIDRQEALAYQHGGEHAKPSDIICLNVRGTEIFARRDTITVVKGSRLEALFSGRWENQLLRDESGRVFIDVDPDMFKKILEYLYTVKISEDVPPLPEVVDDDKEAFDIYMDFFKLRTSVSSEAASTDQTVPSTTMDEKEMMATMTKMKQDLDAIEQELENEESFVAFFTKDGDAVDSSSTGAQSDDDDVSSMETKKSAIFNGIVNLFLNGEIVAYRVKTLCGDMTSKLALDLSDKIWVKEHTIVTENGKACILMEYPGADLKTLVEHFHLKNVIAGSAKKVSLSRKSKYMPTLIKHFYGNDDEKMRSLCCSNIESTIISSEVENEKIKEWLASAGKTSEPKLLYRASRDGWDASDFHRMCDGKGATVTVVKSSGGYIFGGYTDVAWSGGGGWKSSSKSFLFSLKDHAGVGPVQMPIKSDSTGYAVQHNSRIVPIFGNGHDLFVASNANANTSSSSSVGSAYQRPSNTTNPYFLTGSQHFTVSEHEVFLV